MNEKSLKSLEYTKIIELLSDRGISPMGKNLAARLKPTTDFDEVQRRQRETEEAVQVLLKNSGIPLEGLGEVERLIKKTTIGSFLDSGELLEVLDFLRVSKRMKVFIKREKEDGDLTAPILSGLIREIETIPDVEQRIDRSILNESEVSDEASVELRQIRRQLSQANEKVRSTLQNFITSSRNQTYLQDQIITLRQNRYVVPVKQEYRNQVKGMVHDQSTSGATLFIEPMAVVDLNNKLKQLKLAEEQEIERILREISNMIALKENELLKNRDLLGKVDFIFAKGKLALSMKASSPKVNNRGYVNLKNARHPLLNPTEVVPTNIWIGKDFNILVITGPNTGGKTVSLKTLGLLSLMGQSGLQIPADSGTEITIFDHIFADIGDEQSIEQSLSTFSSHMTNIVEIFRNLTENSLVLFDELGAGTDPTEGAALAMAILENLKSTGTKVVATTHYSELKQYALVHPEVENASVEFDVKTLRPTYRLSIGVPGKSNAFEISRKLGLSPEIIDLAKSLITQENLQFEDVLQNIENNKSTIESEKIEIQRLKKEMEELKEKYQEKLEKVENQKQKMVSQAKKEAQTLVKKAKAETEEIIDNLRNLEQEMDRKKVNQEIEKARVKLGNKTLEYRDSKESMKEPVNHEPPKNLKPGERVKILSLNQEGHVLSSEDDKGEVQVQAGIMKVNIKTSNLKRLSSQEDKEIKKTSKMIKTKSQNIRTDIDVRGKNLEEALFEVDKYLDDSYIAGLTQVMIIHGVGTGVLKSGLNEMLKAHRHVQSFRGGKYGEGGAGVTIVDLK
ncbi:endonuclease MutS2 [Isachenkonia alkalipeptolytica]|uniref:Endonuclease MutS2 n=1 Tax=Isachenkonia alkalipeptolytica TaxID=2565777 RepID=A0AA43XKH5_9CLOT|nr:endonuclease MutS2 [Isachenkonia alkalipeptolytica]NBG88540.1 endonuclease MutS2 [Isachenkonia alkalipeptolytica]